MSWRHPLAAGAPGHRVQPWAQAGERPGSHRGGLALRLEWLRCPDSVWGGKLQNQSAMQVPEKPRVTPSHITHHQLQGEGGGR